MKPQIRIPRHIRKLQGGWAAIPYIVAAVSAAGAAYGAVEQHYAGQAKSNQDKFAARIAGDSAKQQEIQRRQDLIRALSTQNAAAGAAGVQTSGSIGAGIRRQINQNANDLLTIDANTSARQNALLSDAESSRVAGNAAAGKSLLDAAVGTYNSLPAGGGSGAPADWTPTQTGNGTAALTYEQQKKLGF